MASKTALTLPLTIMTPKDVTRLQRDLEAYDDRMHQAGLRAKTGNAAAAEPIMPSQVLGEFARYNQCNLEDKAQRTELKGRLAELVKDAPTITVSFAVEPSTALLSKVVEWFRTNTHPAILVRVGLQPNITVGCRVRTPNKLYDFSLRNKFNEQRQILVQRLHQAATQHASVKAPTVEAPHD